jgi:hypothetical protein
MQIMRKSEPSIRSVKRGATTVASRLRLTGASCFDEMSNQAGVPPPEKSGELP